MAVYCENRVKHICRGGGYDTYSYRFAVKMETYFIRRLLYLAAISLPHKNVLWLETFT
jgi:hypothetical protein